MSMHLSPAIRGLATTWETVKDSMVESFSESWGISENSDYPYGWNGSDDMDSEEESSDEKGAPSLVAWLWRFLGRVILTSGTVSVDSH